jgi:long-subunit fatty acid transport protein
VERRGGLLRGAAVVVVVVAWAATFSSNAPTSGYYTLDIGPHTVGRGTAFIVGVDDLTAFALNPAGLARVRGTNLMLAGNVDFFATAYRRSPYEPVMDNEAPPELIPFAGASADFGLADWTFGAAFYVPYGVGERYDPNGPQRYQAIDISGEQRYYLGGVGWRAADWLRLGATAGAMDFTETDVCKVSPFDDGNRAFDINLRADDSQSGVFTWGAGAQFGPFGGFEAGLACFAPADLTLEGTLHARLPASLGVFFGGRDLSDRIKVSYNLPALVGFGVRQRITPALDIEADAQWMNWGRFKTLRIDLAKKTRFMRTPGGYASGSPESTPVSSS